MDSVTSIQEGEERTMAMCMYVNGSGGARVVVVQRCGDGERRAARCSVRTVWGGAQRVRRGAVCRGQPFQRGRGNNAALINHPAIVIRTARTGRAAAGG